MERTNIKFEINYCKLRVNSNLQEQVLMVSAEVLRASPAQQVHASAPVSFLHFSSSVSKVVMAAAQTKI